MTDRELINMAKKAADNAYVPLRPNSFWSFLNQNLETYHLSNSRSIPIGNDKYARGYQGIALRSRF